MQTMPEMDFFLESTQQSPFENTYVYIRIYNVNTVYRPELWDDVTMDDTVEELHVSHFSWRIREYKV